MENERPAKKQSSPQRAETSRTNGRKSKGPKTPEGCLKCSNAAKSQFKHNMPAEAGILTGEPRQRFLQLLENYIDTFKPLSEPEHNVIQRSAELAMNQQGKLLATWKSSENSAVQPPASMRFPPRSPPTGRQSCRITLFYGRVLLSAPRRQPFQRPFQPA